MKKNLTMIAALFSAALSSASCDHFMDVLDQPFVMVTDEEGLSQMNILATAKDLQTTVTISTSSRLMDSDVTISYKVIVGDGLRQGVDFTLKGALEGDLVFVPGVYRKNLYFNWYSNPSLDTSKDCSVTVEITGCSNPEYHIGELTYDLSAPPVKTKYTYNRINN
ncbi:MAG: hypothetical protein HUJ94_05435 [Bacteroidales bacterium]|nr:hypothetical protein [Bacteroidales bacterium]